MMKLQKSILLRAAVLSLAMPIGGCVLGNVREDDPYAVRLQQLEARVEQMERVLKNQSLLQLLDQVQQLQEDLRVMRGQLEVMQNDVRGNSDRQREMYLDLDQRLQSLESSTDGRGGASSASSDDRADYQSAFTLLKESRYKEAEAAFTAFLTKYPQSSFYPNSVYWLGQIQYVNKSYDSAISFFRRVVDEFPSSNKAADAWLKLGYAYYELSKWGDAKNALETVRDQYPDSSSASLATERLRRISKEGH